MRVQKKIILSFVLVLAITSAASAQRRAVPARPDETGVAIALQAGAQSYHFGGTCVCQHAPKASIYNVIAEMWSVQQADAQRSMVLALWRPRSGSGEMFSLNLVIGGRSYVVNTIKAGGAGAVYGSGMVTITSSGAGGTFTVNATAANGAAITGTIKCSAFTEPMVEGG